MKLFRGTLFLFLYWVSNVNLALAYVTYHDIADLKREILANYSQDIRPIKHQQYPINVSLYWYPNAINDFDDVNGILSTLSGVNVNWEDEFVSWNTEKYNVSDFKMPANLFWIPYLGIGNGAESTSFHEKDLDKGLVDFDNHGVAWYTSVSVTKTYCEPNMFYFPFDVHKCTFYFYPRGYRAYEVKFTNTSGGDLLQYKENRSFRIKNFTYKAYIDPDSDISFVAYRLLLQRRPTFILTNHLSPVLALGFVNVFAFLLPIESGERVSYAVTMFLSLAIYLTIIADKLPDNDPVPIFTYFLLGKVIYSCLILLCTIIGLRFHYACRSSYLLKFLDWLILKIKKPRSAKTAACNNANDVCHDDVNMTSDNADGKLMASGDTKTKDDGAWEKNWDMISRKFDMVCFLVFLGVTVTESTLWISLTLYLLR